MITDDGHTLTLTDDDHTYTLPASGSARIGTPPHKPYVSPRLRSITVRQQRILAAIEAGHVTIRAIQAAAGCSSTSVVKANLNQLAAKDHLIIERTAAGERVYSGRDYAAAWDTSARLAGNPDA